VDDWLPLNVVKQKIQELRDVDLGSASINDLKSMVSAIIASTERHART
jgi:hypothetical protein